MRRSLMLGFWHHCTDKNLELHFQTASLSNQSVTSNKTSQNEDLVEVRVENQNCMSISNVHIISISQHILLQKESK